MSRTGSPLSSPLTKHLASAAVAGVVVYLRPRRIPRGLRRGLLATNTAGSVTAMLVGSNVAATGSTQPAPLASRVGPKAPRIGDAATLVGSIASSASLLSSKPALKLDDRVERTLVRKGVRRPRLVMAAGAAGLVVAVGLVTDRIARAAERKVAEAQQEQERQPSGASDLR